MKRVAIAIAVWTIVALLFAGQLAIDSAYTAHRIGTAQALALALTGWYAWALLSPLVIWLARRVRSLIAHALISIVATVVKIALTTEVLRAFGTPQRSISLLVNIPMNVAAYLAIVGVTWFVDARLRASRLEASLAEAKLELLRNQIHPHFLFNTLHAISELMHEDVDAADKMLTRLADLLRASLDSSKPMIALRDELGMLDRYLDIERVRLGDRLRYQSAIEPRALDVLVPNFLLQPLVENAIRHAIALRREGGSIDVRARIDGAKLVITIDDDGPGFAQPNEGIGLANVQARLAQMYGDAARFDIRGDAGTHVRIEIPQ
ncbi:MAG TPA: histidine kinase [Thermoanaerobaculia bacterium]|nr:histidine kinase [Thermoanaerobaculia bacterium]